MGSANSSHSIQQFSRWVVPLKQLTDPLNNGSIVDLVNCPTKCGDANGNLINKNVVDDNIINKTPVGSTTIGVCTFINIFIIVCFSIFCFFILYNNYIKNADLSTILKIILIIFAVIVSCGLSLISFWIILIYGFYRMILWFLGSFYTTPQDFAGKLDEFKSNLANFIKTKTG
jgi:hypothetical protein